jgi:polyisoprenyl-phosphate glycosyltransferase
MDLCMTVSLPSVFDPGIDVRILSIVVPVHNEEEVLPLFHARLSRALAAVSTTAEVIYVDDGSTDGTTRILKSLHAVEPNVAFVRLSRNFGKEQAMTAGLRLARGGAVVLIDADLQDPPERIGEMVQAWQDGADVVNMRRRRRDGESWLKIATARAFYRVINRLSEMPIPRDVGDFRLLSRRAVDAVNAMPERNRFMKGMFAWVGFRPVTIDYDREPRACGSSKWHYWKLWNFALEGITAYSTAPLRIATYAGFSSAAIAFLYALYFLIKTLLIGESVQGFPTLITVMLFLGGLQLMAIGVVGEYLGRMFMETKQRPLFLVDDYLPARTTGSVPAPRFATPIRR